MNSPAPRDWAEAETPRTELEEVAVLPEGHADPVPVGELEQKWGIRVTGISLAGEDSTIDLRYTVVSPDKLSAYEEGSNDAYMVDQASGLGVRLAPSPIATPGAVRSRSLARSAAISMSRAGTFPPLKGKVAPGQTFSVMIPNPKLTLKSGSLVSVVIGGARANDLVVN
jgi:hypothetical protein